MVFLARRPTKSGEPGFTLLELLLVVVLLLGLLGALIYNFGSLQRGASLDEGATQFQALIRFAAATAANSGRAVQFRFEEASTNDLDNAGSNLRVVHEIDPIGQPGLFEDAPEAMPFLRELLERVRFVGVKGAERPVNQGTNDLLHFAEETMAVEMPPITFYPDGSSDSATIVLQSRDAEDLRQMTIHLAGVTGGIRTETSTINEFAVAESTEQEDNPPPPATEAMTELPENPNDFETISTNEFPDEFP